MGETPMSALTLLCSGIQLYSAEKRIADCILADVKWAASATSAELARQSQASEATVTRLCHKLGFESYRKFQLALARDVMEQQEAEKKPRGGSAGPDAEHPAKIPRQQTGRSTGHGAGAGCGPAAGSAGLPERGPCGGSGRCQP